MSARVLENSYWQKKRYDDDLKDKQREIDSLTKVQKRQEEQFAKNIDKEQQMLKAEKEKFALEKVSIEC